MDKVFEGNPCKVVRDDGDGYPVIETHTGSYRTVHESELSDPKPLQRYTVLMYDGISPFAGAITEAPCDDNQANTIGECLALFRKWLKDSDNDYTRAEGYGQPWADVVRTASWDGVSYGDITGGDGVCRFERTGVNGGITRSEF